jgi:hypothetical protein
MESKIKWQTGEPKENGRYIVTNVEGKVDIDYYYSYRNSWEYYHNKAIIAWCHLSHIEPYIDNISNKLKTQ